MIVRRAPCQYTYSRNQCGFTQKNSHYKKNVLNTNFLYRPARCVTHNLESHKALSTRSFKIAELSNVRNLFY